MNHYLYSSLLKKTSRLAALTAAIMAMFIYVSTSDPSVSYWDCPEYVLTASSLQVGHPPGNPIWTLAMRVATIPFPPTLHATVINLCSSLFMALAVFFLARIIYRMVSYVLNNNVYVDDENHYFWLPLIASLFGSLLFAVLDSTWFSAVEAEVYAFSTFLTALSIWMMMRWAEATTGGARDRWLILTAYVMGLSLGVHQLNLLVLPVLALIFVFNRNLYRKATLKAWAAIGFSFLLIGLLLFGMMPGTLEWAASLELVCVNHFGLPYFSGVVLYPILFVAVAILAIIVIPRVPKVWQFVVLWSLLWLSGIFLFSSRINVALFISIIASYILVRILSTRALLTSAWMLIMVWIGYSAIAIILIRGYAAPPINESAPADIFSLQRYIAREQYGSKPLFRGATPFSRPMLEERIDKATGQPDYSRYALRKEAPRYLPAMENPRLIYRSRMLSHEDSALNREIIEKNHGYLLSDYRYSRLTTPELDMWLPRITSGQRNMMSAYADWAGMTEDNMERVEITTAFDSTGHPVGRLLPSGEREETYGKRPTYLQNLRFFLTYQVGYMYLRYLLWNFVGRQNNLPSTGEIDHGNVITGFHSFDRMLTGDERLMPDHAGSDNPGRHVYYGIPFLLGVVGMVWLLRNKRRGNRVMAVITMLFLMTGLAIVVYLNQNPGEPRERDYAFIASYMAFCIWFAFGLIPVAELIDRTLPHINAVIPIMSIGCCALFIWYVCENFPDHNRSDREANSLFAYTILTGKDNDIIFSYGDNFTFPLWYAREVEKDAPGATVVDLSYLATPEYVVNLMKQGRNGLKLTATPADIAYGALAFTRISPDADTIPRPLIEILRSLYASGESSPTIRHSRAFIPGRTLQDTLTLNLRELATVSGMIPFRTLMLLDILATNLEQSKPRPVSFLSSVKGEVTYPLKDALRPEAFSDTYAPHLSTEEYTFRLLSSIEEINNTSYYHFYSHSDPVINDQIRRQRGAYVRAARELSRDSGYKNIVNQILFRFQYLYPQVAPGYYAVADTAFYETLEAAELLLETGGNQDALTALYLVRKTEKDACDWKRYHLDLPAWRRHTVSNESRRLISILPRIYAIKHRADSMAARHAEYIRQIDDTRYFRPR